jgi:hypothetical protein
MAAKVVRCGTYSSSGPHARDWVTKPLPSLPQPPVPEAFPLQQSQRPSPRPCYGVCPAARRRATPGAGALRRVLQRRTSRAGIAAGKGWALDGYAI